MRRKEVVGVVFRVCYESLKENSSSVRALPSSICSFNSVIIHSKMVFLSKPTHQFARLMSCDPPKEAKHRKWNAFENRALWLTVNSFRVLSPVSQSNELSLNELGPAHHTHRPHTKSPLNATFRNGLFAVRRIVDRHKCQREKLCLLRRCRLVDCVSKIIPI